MGSLKAIAVALAITVVAAGAEAWNSAAPSGYGRVIIRNHAERAGLAPVVFDHWIHRSRFTCRLCHIDIGFAMNEGATNITAATNRQGFYCGACHDGKRTFGGKKAFAACSEGLPKENDAARCGRCHSLNRKGASEDEFSAFSEKQPKAALGNGINWEEAEARGLIKPVDFLAGVSIKRPPLKAQKDFIVDVKAPGIGGVIFSHKQHAVWNGCEVCHPEIFPSVQKGGTKYSMPQISAGQYCGVCHDKVAFPLQACNRCHKNS